jgi:E3 ubiquitin-protein ligase RLIM
MVFYRVCPLCRGDVREGGASEPSIPNPEITSTWLHCKYNCI